MLRTILILWSSFLISSDCNGEECIGYTWNIKRSIGLMPWSQHINLLADVLLVSPTCLATALSLYTMQMFACHLSTTNQAFCANSSSMPVHKQLLAPSRMLVQEINIIAAAPFCFLLAMLYFLPQVLPFILLMLWIGHHSAISWPNKFTEYQPSCVSWTNWWARSSPFVARSLIGLAFLQNLLADT